jgi:hypothetical protein
MVELKLFQPKKLKKEEQALYQLHQRLQPHL